MKKLFVLLVSVLTIYIAVVAVGLHRDSSTTQYHVASAMINMGFNEEAVSFINKAARVDIENGRLGNNHAQLLKVFVYSGESFGQMPDNSKSLKALYASMGSGATFPLVVEDIFSYHEFLVSEAVTDEMRLKKILEDKGSEYIQAYVQLHERMQPNFELDVEGYKKARGLQ